MPDRGNILIVYDNSSSVKTLEELLTDTGYVVNRAVSGEEALAAIYVSEPNLILLGDHLPDIGPFALLKKLKQDQQTLYIPVIFLTAVDDTETRIKAVELGDDLITIPLEAREVLARVERQVTVSKVRMALRESETKFRSVMESAIDAIISADHTGHIVSWNNAATRILGYSSEETIGRRLEIIIPERFHEAHRKGMQRVTAGGESRVIGKTVELFARTKSGKEVPIELSLSTWTVREDRYYTGIIRDIRERKQAEEALRMSEQALRAKTQELKEKNDMLGNALNKLQEIQNQLIMQEKMASLGKLSAGMAHELNNPAAAAQRGAAQVQALFVQLRDAYLKIGALNLEKKQIDKVIALGQLAGESAKRPDDADALFRSDRESALEDWLEDKGLENAWQLASPLVSMGFDRSEIDQLAEHFTPNQIKVKSGEEALDAVHQLKRRNTPIALFLVDQRMPGMSGTEFLEGAVKLYPEARKVLLTAYADTDAAITSINTIGLDYYLMKPWDPPEQNLYPVLDDLLSDWVASVPLPYDGIRVAGTQWSACSHIVKDFLARNQIPYQWLDIERDAQAQTLVETVQQDRHLLPVVFFPDGSTLVDPDLRTLAGKMGLHTKARQPFYDLIIIGAGPAGLAAAVYGASEGLRTVVIEKEATGGQAGTSSRIENYLGFPQGLSGVDLARRATIQATRLGAEILTAQEATRIRVEDPYRFVTLSDGTELSCHALLIASGMTVRKPDVPGIFAAGDVRHGVVRRVASAVGQGAVAVSFIHKYLETV